MRIFLFVLSAGCTPHLESEPRATCGGEELENSWEKSAPPVALEGEGFSRGSVVPDFCLEDQNGDRTSLWQFYGDVILLDISTMWCGPCQQIAKDVEETWHDYSEEGFTYITVLPEDLEGGQVDRADLQEWSEEFGITAPILADNEGFGYSVEPERAWPVVMLIDRKMSVLVERIAPNDHAIREAIEAAL